MDRSPQVLSTGQKGASWDRPTTCCAGSSVLELQPGMLPARRPEHFLGPSTTSLARVNQGLPTGGGRSGASVSTCERERLALVPNHSLSYRYQQRTNGSGPDVYTDKPIAHSTTTTMGDLDGSFSRLISF
jgi:hypothetical protein